jgi:hypothetical protein
MKNNGSSKPEVPATIAPKAEKTARQLAAEQEYTPRYETPARKPGAERPNSFNPLAWLADGVTGVVEEVRHNDLGLSQEFWTHLYAARRESLMTAQAFVNSLLAWSESAGDKQAERQQQRERRGNVQIKF